MEMSSKKSHQHAELLRAIADGEQIQFCTKVMLGSTHWEEFSHREALRAIEHCETLHWRIKPQPKPDIINKMFVEAYPKLDNAWNTPNLELTFDGETQKLKAVRILDAT